MTGAPQADEVWLPVASYEGLYEVSSHGRVRNASGRIMGGRAADKDGYLVVSLSSGGTARVAYVHRLVAKAFHEERQNALHCQVAHLDGSRQNNRADNLKWVSHAENQSHKRAHGTHQSGERNPRAKLSTEQALEIRQRSRLGESPLALANQFGVCPKSVRRIRDGEAWNVL